jgi:hypothetical protein
LPARRILGDLELLRPALLGIETTDAAAHYHSTHAMRPRLSFLFALVLLAVAAVPEAAAERRPSLPPLEMGKTA